MKPYIISGIDIGNSQVKVIIAKIDRDNLRAEAIGVGCAASNGLRRGMVVDMEETVDNIRTAVQRAEAMAGETIRKAYVAVNGSHIESQISRAAIAISRADGEISQGDIERVQQMAASITLPANREVIDVIPRNYVIDGNDIVKNPLGMKGFRLEVEVYVIHGLSPYLRNITKCVHENNIEVADLVFAPLASALAVLDKNQKEYGVLNLDFGGGVSTLTVFEEADLLRSVVLPVGSKHITADLAVSLRAPIDVAERVKIEHGSTSEGEDMRRKENIDLSELMGERNFILPKKQVIKVIDARAQELLELVLNELKRFSKGMLPAGVVLSGGGANLPGLASLVKEKLRLPVRVGTVLNLTWAGDNINDPAFAVVAGLIAFGIGKELSVPKSKGSQFANSDLSKKVIGWLKNFMP